jgi:hypothetical protein
LALAAASAMALAILWWMNADSPIVLDAEHEPNGISSGPRDFDTSGSGSRGIAPRPVDSPALITRWTAPGADPERVSAALLHGREPLDLVFDDYDANADLVHWATGDADTSPRGKAVARCYARSLDSLHEPCGWNQRVVIQRTGSTVGEVVYVEQLFGEVERSCEIMIACVNEAWRGVSAPLPTGSDEYVTLDFVAYPCFLGEGRVGEAHTAAIEEREAMATTTIESLTNCERDACRYNSRIEQTCRTHLAELQRALAELRQ